MSKWEKIVFSFLLGSIIMLWFIEQELTSELYFNSINPDLTPEIHRLRIENNQLRIELLQKESYLLIYREATNKGFIQGKTIYLQP